MKTHEQLTLEGWTRCTPGNRPKSGFVNIFWNDGSEWSLKPGCAARKAATPVQHVCGWADGAIYFRPCDSAGNPLAPVKQALRLEVGKRYNLRRGGMDAVIGPLFASSSDKYPFFCRVLGYTWTADGVHSIGKIGPADLISEYTEPAAKVEAPKPLVTEAEITNAIKGADKWIPCDGKGKRVPGKPIYIPLERNGEWFRACNPATTGVERSNEGLRLDVSGKPSDAGWRP